MNTVDLIFTAVASATVIGACGFMIWATLDYRRDMRANAATYEQRQALLAHAFRAGMSSTEYQAFCAVSYDEHFESLRKGLDPLPLYGVIEIKESGEVVA